MAKPADKKKRILKAARDLFARYGLRKCSIADIARAARVGKGTIYLYFASKEEMFAAVVEREARILFDHIEREIATIDDPADKLHRYVLSRFDHLQELGNLLEISREVINELEPLVEQARGRFISKETNLVERIIEQGRRSGAFSVTDSRVVAAVIVLGIKGLEFPMVLQQFPGFLDRGGIESMVEVLLNGLRSR